MSGHIKRFLSEDVAATAIEYGLIAALVSVGAMGDFRLRCRAD
jgi:Flp pilus assembly pilin Flp